MEEAGIYDESSEAAMWGTAAHLISSLCLEQGIEPAVFHGRTVVFQPRPAREMFEDELQGHETVIHRIVPDDEMIECCTRYVDFVRALVESLGAYLMVEQRVRISWITGEHGATGTSDCVIVTKDELIIVDLKGGMGQVDAFRVLPAEVDVITGAVADVPVYEPNSQMAMYAGGALHDFAWMGPFKRVRMIIVQPRLHHVSDFDMSVEDLLTYLKTLSVAAERTRTNPVHVPGDHCHFCKAKANCKALQQYVFDTVIGDFDDLAVAQPRTVCDPELGVIYERLDIIETWCEAIRARVRAELTAGRRVIGANEPYKLVEGKLAARRWENQARAEKLAVVFLGENAHTRKFKSPTQLEELLKKKHPQQWQVISQHVAEQGRTQPVIVPASNPKPALPGIVDDFADLSSPVASLPADADDILGI